MLFGDFALHPLLLKALVAEGYTVPTDVQTAAIPPALAGHDILATAETGTGKTAAFLLPALTRIVEAAKPRLPGAPHILVLAPTRELARQVTQSVRTYGKFLRLNSVDIVGGMPYRDQLRLLARPVDVVVATPGRLLDHLERGRLDLSSVEVMVLDEADRMLDMGFSEDVALIAKACGAQRQTMLFTATLDRRMSGLAEKLLNDPVRIAVQKAKSSLHIEQRLHQADDLAHKRRLLDHVIAAPEVTKAIIFVATKRDADSLARTLVEAGHLAAPLHGDMSQAMRNRTVERLRAGRVRLLIATDVAARGLDVRDISHVVNFDLPRAPEDYIHRIGRTGRAGASGVAISFASRADRDALARIERYTGSRMTPEVVPGLEPRRPAPRPAGRSVPHPAAERSGRPSRPATPPAKRWEKSGKKRSAGASSVSSNRHGQA